VVPIYDVETSIHLKHQKGFKWDIRSPESACEGPNVFSTVNLVELRNAPLELIWIARNLSQE
jgi:hypothetical protein